MLASKEYAEKRGLHCPNCGSTQFEGGPVEIDEGIAWQEIGCSNCPATWNDIYALIGYADLEVGESDEP
jgi:hypothetical protein